MEPDFDAELADIAERLVILRAAIESEIASHANCQTLLDAALATANVERARADLAERKLVALRKETK